MNCPACGRPLGGGEARCNACGSMVVPPLEGALAPDPSGVAVSSRGRVEPLREIPGLRKKERTWKDEVRDRVRDRRRRRGNDGELPLFREPEEAAPKPASGEATPVAEPPRAEPAPLDDVAVPTDSEGGLGGPTQYSQPPAASEGDLLTRASGGFGGVRRSTPLVNEEEPLDLEMRPPETTNLDEPAIAVAVAEVPEPEPERVDSEGEWLLEPARPREEARRPERPATLFDRIKAAAIDLALLSGLWAIVVYFAGRTARVSVWGSFRQWGISSASWLSWASSMRATSPGPRGRPWGRSCAAYASSTPPASPRVACARSFAPLWPTSGSCWPAPPCCRCSSTRPVAPSTTVSSGRAS